MTDRENIENLVGSRRLNYLKAVSLYLPNLDFYCLTSYTVDVSLFLSHLQKPIQSKTFHIVFPLIKFLRDVKYTGVPSQLTVPFVNNENSVIIDFSIYRQKWIHYVVKFDRIKWKKKEVKSFRSINHNFICQLNLKKIFIHNNMNNHIHYILSAWLGSGLHIIT